MFDPNAQTFGLPPCLRIPIAATGLGAIAKYVGAVAKQRTGRDGRVNALGVRPYASTVARDPGVKLWQTGLADYYSSRLHPPMQVWVHVDYTGYRDAYQAFGMPAIPAGYCLDHIQNRQAIRLRDFSHPYLRLCPVSRGVNTSGGHRAGGEGMEKAFLEEMQKEEPAELRRVSTQSQIIYADPMDLTKMLNMAPGTRVLSGVRDAQALFYV